MTQLRCFWQTVSIYAGTACFSCHCTTYRRPVNAEQQLKAPSDWHSLCVKTSNKDTSSKQGKAGLPAGHLLGVIVAED